MLKAWSIYLGLLIISSLLAACGAFPDLLKPSPISYTVDLSDVDGDGDLDAVVGNAPGNTDYSGEPNSIWFNDGSGNFTDSGQRLIGSRNNNWDVTRAVALGDLDADGDIDALFGNAIQSPSMIWLNDGAGQFEFHSGYRMQSNAEFNYSESEAVALDDLDGDGDLDVYVGNCCRNAWAAFDASEITAQGYSDAYNMVWLNNGDGHFTDSKQHLGNSATGDVALGDLDGDGDLDAFEVNQGGSPEFNDSEPGDMIWFNDGTGLFTDSGQRLGDSDGYAVALGDVDGDGDLDAFVGNAIRTYGGRPNEVWLNDGTGHFSDSEQRLGSADTRVVVLSDLDHDGDLDAFVGNQLVGQVWLNDGSGYFHDSGQRFDWSPDYAVDLADIDNDGDEDVFAIRFNGRYRIWVNNGAGRFNQK